MLTKRNLKALKNLTPVAKFGVFVPKKYQGPGREEIAQIVKDNLSAANTQFYSVPLAIVQGNMQYLYDTDGKEYLDLFGGVNTVGCGHCHPRITAKLIEQAQLVQHISTLYHHDQQALYAQELTAKLPKGLDVAYFATTGSEANAMATHFARIFTGNFPIITLKNGYHGHGGSQHLTNTPAWNHNIPKSHGVEKAAFPDQYRGISGEHAGEFYASDVDTTIEFTTAGSVALFMAETVQGVGGLCPLPDGYLERSYQHVRAAGGLCLSDEVQCGFGRLGSHYWGFETQGVVPDIVTMAKSIGNGFPMSAVVTSKEIASCLRGASFNTYGSNPIAMAVGREVIKVIDEEKMQENCRNMSALIMDGFKDLQKRYHNIGDVRGKGLMLGMEIVSDNESKTPRMDILAKIHEKTLEHGILIGRGGRFGNVFRVQPPMCIDKKDVEKTLDALDKSFKEVTTGESFKDFHGDLEKAPTKKIGKSIFKIAKQNTF